MQSTSGSQDDVQAPPVGHSRPEGLHSSEDERLAPGDLLVLAALVALACCFYVAPWAWLYLPALIGVAVLTWRRLDLALGLVLLFAPAYMAPKHFGTKEFAPAEVFLALDVGIAVLRFALVRAERDIAGVRRSPFLMPCALLLVAGLVSTIFAADLHHAARYYVLWVVEPVAFFGLVLLFVTRPAQWVYLFGALLLAGGWVAALSIGQYATGQDLTLVPGTTIKRVHALYGSPDNVGLLFDRVVPLWFVLTVGGRMRGTVRIGMGLLGLLYLPALYLTGSRGAEAAILLTCAAVLAVTAKWGRWLIVVTILLVGAALLLKGPALVHAVSSGHTNTAQRRVDLWESSLRMIRNRPIVGVGPDNFLHYYAPTRSEDLYNHECAPGLGYMSPGAGAEPCLSHPHDEFLDFWLSAGIFGLVAFLWLMWVFWRSATELWTSAGAGRSRVLLIGAMAAMLASLLHGLVDNSYFLEDLAFMFWLLCGYVSILTAGGASSELGRVGSIRASRRPWRRGERW